nr:hypothetical protein [Kibdelosporangium sp. MJ126-NF4]
MTALLDIDRALLDIDRALEVLAAGFRADPRAARGRRGVHGASTPPRPAAAGRDLPAQPRHG